MMEKFIQCPDIQMYLGIKVDKDTKIEYKNDNVEQTIENLVLKSKTKIVTEDFESTYDTTIKLQEGDILIFEDEGRGYIKPVEKIVSIEEAIETLNNIKD